jgi:hypothetical protein
MPTFPNTNRDTAYMPARPNLGQPLQSQPLSSYLSSLSTLPGVIPPTLIPEAIEVPQF